MKGAILHRRKKSKENVSLRNGLRFPFLLYFCYNVEKIGKRVKKCLC